MKNVIGYLDENSLRIIHNNAAVSEELGMLNSTLLQLIYEQRWFKLFVPKNCGGLQMGLPEALHLQEALAYADGSLAWTVTLCSGAGWFAGFLSPNIASEFLLADNCCLAGSGMSAGIANKMDNGYEITGEWDYATGAQHATAFTANCFITQNGIPLLDESGNKIVRAFVFKKEEVTVKKTWKSSGMMATGSHGFFIDKLTVNADRSFVIEPTQAMLLQCVYQYPFLQLAEATLAINISGMAVHFLEESAVIIGKRILNKNIPEFAAAGIEKLLKESVDKLDKYREALYDAVNQTWLQCEAGIIIDEHLLKDVSIASRNLADFARKSAEALYPHCGMQVTVFNSPINRVWRDLHTASQHSLLLYER
jgi:alkylation response protein AidB-like acyl-CoA dehydrogenase